MNAEEVDFAGNVVGAKWSVREFLSAGPDDNRMKVVVPPDPTCNQPSPINRHSIRGLAPHNPQWRFVIQIPRDDRALVGIATPKFFCEICLQPQHLRVPMRMAPIPPRHIPIGLAYFSTDK